MIQLKAAFAQYYDTDGTPLDGGYIYFGEAGANPETHPITVYSDFEATQPMAQPLRTTAGVVMVNGSPSRVYAVDLNYSVTVKNKRGAVVFSALDFAPESNEVVDYADAVAAAAAAAASEAAENEIANQYSTIRQEVSNIAASFTNRGNWTTGTVYSAGEIGNLVDRREIVYGPVGSAYETTCYVVMVDHTSGVFADDVSSGKLLNTDAAQLAMDLAVDGSTLIGADDDFAGLFFTTVQGAFDRRRLTVEKARDMAAIRQSMNNGETVTIACLGDSTTWGSDASNTGTQVADPYPEVLQSHLRSYYQNNNITVINHGYSGATSLSLLENRIDDVIADAPDAVLLMCGINDATPANGISVQQYARNMESMIAMLHAAGIAVAILSPIETTSNNGESAEGMVSYRLAAKQVASEWSAEYLDVSTILKQLILKLADARGTLRADRVHLSQEGYKLLADVVAAKLLFNCDTGMSAGEFRDANELGLRWVSGAINRASSPTEHVNFVSMPENSVARLYVYCDKPGQDLVGHFRLTVQTAEDFEASYANLSTSQTPETLTLTTVNAGAFANSVSHNTPFTLCRLRAGLNVIEFETSAGRRLFIYGFSLVTAARSGYLATYNAATGVNRYPEPSPTPTGFVLIKSPAIYTKDLGLYGSGQLIVPSPADKTFRLRIRAHISPFGKLRFGQASKPDGVYNQPFAITFNPTTAIITQVNNVDAGTEIGTISHATPTGGNAKIIDIVSSAAAGMSVYIGGTLLVTTASPMPVGDLTVDSSLSASGALTVIESVAEIGSGVTMGANIPGEKWFDYITPAIKMVSPAGAVVSVTLA